MAESRKTYTFGEKTKETIKGKTLSVYLSPKYQESKEAAINLLNSKEFGQILSEGDFWILKNTIQGGEKLAYSGLIITHDALLKINDALPDEKKFNEKYCSEAHPYEYNGKKGMLMYYRDDRDGMMEIGEISNENLSASSYPFAMLLKRTFDRVVKRKAGLIGVMSESESDGFNKADNSFEDEINTKTKKEYAATNEKLDLETGEIIEEPNTLDKALGHTFQSLSGKNLTIRKLLESEKLTDDEKGKYLAKYILSGTDDDKKACLIVKTALDNGENLFKNSKAA